MAVEIKNELRAAAIVAGSDGGAALQLFGLTFERTGVGVYVFTMDGDVDPTQVSIYCSPGINELALPRGRFTSAAVLEVRSYTPDGVPADCVVLFVEVHRYPGRLGATFPAAPPIPTPTPPGGGAALVCWGNNGVAATTVTRYLEPWFDDANAPTNRIQWVAPRDGTIAGLNVIHNSPAGNGGNIVYTLEVNAGATLLAVTLASTGSTAVNDAEAVAVLKGDLISLEVTKAISIGASPNDIVATANFS